MATLTMHRLLLVLLALLTSVVQCRSYVIQYGTWKFRGHPIAYEQAHVVVKDDEATATKETNEKKAPSPILLLNGFGVGSFHQHRLIHEMMQSNKEFGASRHGIIYCIDYLGQGKSWPKDCNDGQAECEVGLRYCGQTWVDQITQFIEQVVLQNDNNSQQKIHIVGNSVGGHLAVFVAANRPDLVESLTLLNATPVWGLNLPGWNGHLPAPRIPKAVGRYLFDRIRDWNTIEKYLENAYVNRAAFDDDDQLVRQIRSCTEGPGGHAAFASILWSPPVTASLPKNGLQANFHQCLSNLECDVLLLFGRDDPWCKPAFARKMLQDLNQRRPDHTDSKYIHRYVELSNVGHCPNHEAPTAVAKVLSAWLDAAPEQAQPRSAGSAVRRDGPRVVGHDRHSRKIVRGDSSELGRPTGRRVRVSYACIQMIVAAIVLIE